ncbi:MAG TPA: cobalamin-independent methionine synthase II family protein [Acidimicrobiales bacterium]|nr:cobalamin-independent methionine synthase II family protein [Acidimicrobiales bacterium]
MVEAHSDVVGSMLRPVALSEARQRFASGQLSTADLKAAEDRAVNEAIAVQEEAGVGVVTDGEMRRLSFQSQLPSAVEGLSDWDIDAFLWGDWHGDEDVGGLQVDRPELAVVGKLRRRRSLCAEEFAYARGRTDRVLKVTLPSPSLFANFWDPGRAPREYRALEDFLTDVASLLREEADELQAMGATYLQLDAPHYTMVLDPRYEDFYASRGWRSERWLELGLELDNLVIGDRPDVTFGFHLCRGNQASRWLVEGGYGAVAEKVFRGIRADRLLLEYDDARSGTFEPLMHVPDDRWVVLGLVTTKRARLESLDDLVRRIDAASRYVPDDRLAISPQCGFATSVLGNALTIDDEKAKLGLVARTARSVWG